MVFNSLFSLIHQFNFNFYTNKIENIKINRENREKMKKLSSILIDTKDDILKERLEKKNDFDIGDIQ
jgi:hypothetical protein